MLGAILAAALSQCEPVGAGAVLSCPATNTRRLGGDPGPIFEFAPASGAGMTATCACSNPTGSKGEVLTFTRASSGACLKGSVSTGIAIGDLVTCSSNQARVMPGGAGTGGDGLLVESEATNLDLRSQELDNVVWVKSQAGGGSNPTVTADYALSPENTMTAERVQFSACTADGSSSLLYQIGLGTTGAYSGSVFCHGTSASQVISVCGFSLGTVTGTCVQVTCPATGYARAKIENFSVTTSGGLIAGCVNQSSVYAGALSTGAADVVLWGEQWETGTHVTSYVATTSAAATRAAETAYVTLPASLQTTGLYSIAATLTVGKTSAETWFGWENYTATSSPGNRMFNVSPTMYCETTNVLDVRHTRAAAGSLTTDTRIVCFNDGATENGIFGGVVFSGTPGSGSKLAPSNTRFYLGNAGSLSTVQIDGVIKNVIGDAVPTRSR